MGNRRFLKKSIVIAIGLAVSAETFAQSQNTIDEIVVRGSSASLQSAIQKQRNSDKVISVIDSDSLGNFADTNVAESLRRIAGIMVENDQGEGRYVTVRGMNTDLNAMTINGVSTASPENRRGIILDGVPSDLLDSMTVYKTLTPNLDADTIGGAINLETITGFSNPEMFVRLKAETSYNELTEDSSNPKLAATFTNRWNLGDGEAGVAVVLSDQTRRIVADNHEVGGWSATAPDDDYELRFYDLERERQGVVLALDYRANSGNSYFAHFFHNEYSDTEWRAKWETRRAFDVNEPVVNGSTFSYANSRVDTEGRNRTEERKITSIRLGTKLQLSEKSLLEVEYFTSEAEQDDGDRQASIFRSPVINEPITFNNSDPRQPVVTFAPGFYDPSIFELNAHEREFALNTDEDNGVKIDFTHQYNDNTEMQFGLKYRAREKTNEYNFCGYEPANDILLSSVNFVTPAPFLSSVFGPTPTFEQVKAFNSQLGTGSSALSDGTTCPNPGAAFDFSGDEDAESVPADWLTEEDVLSAYAMATTVAGSSTWVYGLRLEDTQTTYNGKAFDGDVFTGRTQFENNYSFLAPSLNVKFDLSDNQVMRAGIFRSLVRPGFEESRAGAVVDTEDREIEGGNPQLDPTIAWNFDLTYEYYLGTQTFFGAGVFYKSLQDAIVAVEATDIQFRGELWNVAGTFVNTDDSSIAGFELSFQTLLENGFLFVANYTYSDGETDLPVGSISGQRTIPFFKQAKNTANLAIGYDKGPWDIRLATNYRSDFLDDIGGNPLSDRYTSDFMQMDLTARYEVNENLMITAEAINLNDEPEFYYFGNANRLSQYDEYGTTYGMGLRYSF
jgi:TonB-dependent receptor